jgi:membrane protease YdiL (CAAX protease family)/gamma-glutamylcyclotransferase (GGCT)/AIG2-like uncharacterized protein YtfP
MMTAKRALLLGILCWLSYMLLRTLFQHWIPVHDWKSYILQDLSITVLRLGSAGICLWIAKRRWSMEALGLSHSVWPAPVAMASLLVAGGSGILNALSMTTDWNAAVWIRFVEIAIAFAVALNEEIGFRGLIFNGIRELAGPKTAILISSLLFTAMHLGYQPLYSMLSIFFTGLCFATLRVKGVSLKIIILLHFFYDGCFALELSGNRVFWNYFEYSEAMILLASVLAWMAHERYSIEGEHFLFVYGTLRRSEAAAKRLGILKRSDLIGNGYVPGKIVDRGGYPALVLSPKSKQTVSGEIIRLRDHALLEDLDRYEGEEYLRQRVNILTPSGALLETWVYTAR